MAGARVPMLSASDDGADLYRSVAADPSVI
jgi:hypothetical protein